MWSYTKKIHLKPLIVTSWNTFRFNTLCVWVLYVKNIEWILRGLAVLVICLYVWIFHHWNLQWIFTNFANAGSALKNLPCKINFGQNWCNTKLPFREVKIRLKFLNNYVTIHKIIIFTDRYSYCPMVTIYRNMKKNNFCIYAQLSIF
jgi:hypothetical protein